MSVDKELVDKIRQFAQDQGVFVSKTLKVFDNDICLFEAKSIEELFSFLNFRSKLLAPRQHTLLQAAKPDTFEFKTTPYKHQHEIFSLTKEMTVWGLFMEMGTGKTKICIDTMAWLFQQKQIKQVLILAPNGVHRMWLQELVSHCAAPYQSVAYQSGRPSIIRLCQNLVEQSLPDDRLWLMAINIEALISKTCFVLAKKFLAQADTLLILDESSKIKNPRAKRTKLVQELGKQAKYKRALTGTPITQGPFDVYAQMEFLQPGFWHGQTYLAFCARYAKLESPLLKRNLGVFLRTVTQEKLRKAQEHLNSFDDKQTLGKKQARDAVDKMIQVYNDEHRVIDQLYQLKIQGRVNYDSVKALVAPNKIKAVLSTLCSAWTTVDEY